MRRKKTQDTPADKEAKRLVALLSRLVRMSNRSLRSLEEELDLGSSVVSKILSGTIRPQLSYVLMISEAIGVPPGLFFRLAYPKSEAANPMIQEFLEAEGLKLDQEHVADELKDRMREAIAEVLAEVQAALRRKKS